MDTGERETPFEALVFSPSFSVISRLRGRVVSDRAGKDVPSALPARRLGMYISYSYQQDIAKFHSAQRRPLLWLCPLRGILREL